MLGSGEYVDPENVSVSPEQVLFVTLSVTELYSQTMRYKHKWSVVCGSLLGVCLLCEVLQEHNLRLQDLLAAF